MRYAMLVLAAMSLFVWTALAQENTTPASNEDEAGATEGVRPYELDWAGRNAPNHAQLADFEDLTGWRVRCFDGAEAALYRSRQEKLFGEYTAKVLYSGKNARSRFIVEPPEPLPIPCNFTAANLWVRGNNWGFIDPAATARVSVWIRVIDAKGEVYRVDMRAVDFDYWHLMHATCVSPDGREKRYEPEGEGNDGVLDFPARFAGIEIRGCADPKPARLYFDALQLYEIQYPPLEFAPIPEDLPWPTTPDTILPERARPASVRPVASEDGHTWACESVADDETIRFSYTPDDGTLNGVVVETRGFRFQPCRQGGPAFEADGKRFRPGDPDVQMTLNSSRPVENGAEFHWTAKSGDAKAHYSYAFRVKGKSLIVDVSVEEPIAAQFDIGIEAGLAGAKAVFFPYLTYGDDWPRVVCADGPNGPVFLLSLIDYYNSDASELYGSPRVTEDGALSYAGGAAYLPTTAGVRNPMRERIFINVGRDVHEVLPNIPNPTCDTGDIARECLWCNIGQAFQNERLTQYKAYGIDKFIACHHEVGWREAGESFTLRDRPAPSIGDEPLQEYGEFVKGLGYRFGTYTNYTDFTPVNANWSEDDVCLDSEGRWQTAWPRCYALKPLRAAEFEADYAARIHERYGTTAQYCDVHTAYRPWDRTDYDARTPGAGKFRTQFNAYARLLWNESKAHHGPVFSEGNYHWFYAGIVDGDYATMVPYGRGWTVPHLVDFDLLEMHPKMTDFGMGYGQMYFGMEGVWMDDASYRSPYFDRFHAATIAFGHIGFLSYEWGFEGTLKSYYLLQALQQRYTMIPVKAIRYFDGERLVDTSTALLTDAYKRQQIHVEYESGLETWCNLSFEDPWTVELDGVAYELPPTGFLASKPGDILEYSAVMDGQRREYVRAPEYLYLDTRGALARTPDLETRGTVAVKRDGENVWWIIPATACDEVTLSRAWLGVDANAEFVATAYGIAGEPIEPATVLPGVGEVTVLPSQSDLAIKYKLTAAPSEDKALAIASVDIPQESAMPGAAIPVSAAIVTPSVDAADLEVLWRYRPRGTDVVSEGRADTVSSDTAGRFSAKLEIALPRDAATGTRGWFAFTARTKDGASSDTRWANVSVVPPFSVTFPESPMRVPLGPTFALKTQVASHFCRAGFVPAEMGGNKSRPTDAVQATAQLSVEGIAANPGEQSLSLEPETPAELEWSVAGGEMPVTAKLTLAVEGGGQRVEAIRYLRTRPAEWVVANLMEQSYTLGQCQRGGKEMPYDHLKTMALVFPTRETLADDRLEGLHMHPPYKGGVGYVFATFRVPLPEGRPMLDFALGFKDGSTTQDGCLFRALVVEEDGRETEVFSEQYATLGQWSGRSADLSAFAGKIVGIKLVADVGPADNSYSDWALWGAPRVVMREPALEVELLEEPAENKFGPPPEPPDGVTQADLASVVSATLSLECAGVDQGNYASFVYFNNIKIGVTPTGGADTTWGEADMPLPEEALKTIGALNFVVVRNPNQDYMKVRRFCLHFMLADGRRGSSCVDLGPYTSAAGWPYGEGECVPAGKDLPEIVLSIPVE